MRIVCVSDTHTFEYAHHVPEGDVLIHAGDVSLAGTFYEVRRELDIINSFPHKHKILVPGNHDWIFQNNIEKITPCLKQIHCLINRDITIDTFKFWGSPYQPWFLNWAFNLPRGEPLARIWANIPDELDVLITHSPPYKRLDKVPNGDEVGCHDMRQRVDIVKPKLHVFGHIHHSYGQMKVGGTIFVNASVCNEGYQPINRPIVIDL